MKTWLRLTLITMTVGGGFAGVLITGHSLVHSEGQGLPYLVIMAAFLTLYTLVTASGLLFVHDPRRVQPLFAALATQIPWISSPLIVYKVAAGFHAVLTIGSPEEVGTFGVHFGAEALLGSMFSFVFCSAKTPWSIGVNLFALLLLVLLWKSARTSDPVMQPIATLTADSACQANSTFSI